MNEDTKELLVYCWQVVTFPILLITNLVSTIIVALYLFGWMKPFCALLVSAAIVGVVTGAAVFALSKGLFAVVDRIKESKGEE